MQILEQLLEEELGFDNMVEIDVESLEDLCEEANATIEDAIKMTNIRVSRAKRYRWYRIHRV